MSNVNFTDILNKKAADTEEPKPLPTGTYLGAIQSLPEQRTVDTKDGERATLRFKVKVMMPKEDVDLEKLAECGDIATLPPINHDLWIDTSCGRVCHAAVPPEHARPRSRRGPEQEVLLRASTRVGGQATPLHSHPQDGYAGRQAHYLRQHRERCPCLTLYP